MTYYRHTGMAHVGTGLAHVSTGMAYVGTGMAHVGTGMAYAGCVLMTLIFCKYYNYINCLNIFEKDLYFW